MGKVLSRKDMNGSILVRVMALVLAAVVLMGTAPTGILYANAAEEATVASWAELKDAVEKGSASTIKVTGNIAASEPITVGRDVTIKGDNVTIFRSAGAESQDFSAFVVAKDGNLVLGSGITMTGERGCEAAPAGDGEEVKQNTLLEFYTESGLYLWPKSDGTVDVGNRAQVNSFKFSITSNGYLKYDGKYLGNIGGTFKFDSSVSTENAVRLMNRSGGFVTAPLSNTEEYFLGVKNGSWKFLKFSGGLQEENNTSSADAFRLVGDETVSNSGSGSGSDQTCGDTGIIDYTKEDINGTKEDPKGFFVQVNEGGAFELNGATLTKFTTPTDETQGESNPTPFWVAPVVVNGGEFTLTDGSITENRVGYTIKTDSRNGDEFTSGDIVRTKRWLKGLPLNNCAGAVIFANGAKGDIDGGDINNNKGASGAMIITGAGTEVNLNDGAKVNNNVGLLFAGAALVDDGATLNMNEGAQMNKNITWNRGGAVWASDWGTNGFVAKNWSTKPPKITNPEIRQAEGGTFNMYGGTLEGNTALIRGGAINVESNNVHLYGGDIKDNKCYSLGGGIYVEGDSADYSYTLHIREGYIGENDALDEMSGPKDSDFKGFYADGGGVWLCPIGGTGALTISDDEKVVINNNDAVSDGKDVYLIRGNGSLIVSALGKHDWLNEATNKNIDKGKSYSGPIGLTNLAEETVKQSNGIQITGNKARDGGGIAADGTVILGEPEYIYKQEASINFVKKWSEELVPKETKFRVKYTDGNTEYVLDEFTLDGEEDENVVETEPTIEREKADEHTWNASISIPTTYIDADQVHQALFKYVDPADSSKVIDPSTADGLKQLCKLSAEQIAKLEVAPGTWKFVIEELDDDGNVSEEYIITSDDIVVDSFDVKWNASSTTTVYAGETFTVNVNYATVQFGQGMNNDVEPAIEKYVNQAVHKDIALDEEFTYDIMGYVPMNADKFVITDKLVEDLEFATEADAITVVDVGGKNNHKPVNNIHNEAIDGNDDATVGQDGDEVEGAVVEIKDGTLTVEIANELVELTGENESGWKNADKNQNLTPHRGHWIKVTFKAQIKESLQDEIKAGTKTLADLKSVTIIENDPVLSDETHGGIDNTAELHVEAKNEHLTESDLVSNTVTVKPEEPGPEKYIRENVHADIDVDETFEYQIISYVSMDADKITISDELDSLLQFTDKAIKVYNLGKTNNHMTADKAEEEGKDATVSAKDAEDITGKATIKAEDGVLEVVIANELDLKDGKVQANEDGTIKYKSEDLTPYRGCYIMVVFEAELTDAAKADLAALAENYESISDNDPLVVTDEQASHDGIPNKAKVKIDVGNQPGSEIETNTVTVKPEEPEEPEIEKYVNKASDEGTDKDGGVHTDLSAFDEIYTYDIQAYVTKDAKFVEITDELVAAIELVNQDKIYVGYKAGEGDDGKVAPKLSKESTEIEDAGINYDSEANKLVITLGKDAEDATVLPYAGQWVQVTFNAQIKEGYRTIDAIKEVTDVWEEVVENVPIDDATVDEEHSEATIDCHAGILNKTEYDINKSKLGFDLGNKYYDKSNTVTVVPPTPEVPEIEKYINQNVHEDIDVNDEFTYDIIAYVTKDADKVIITDELDSQLEMVDGSVKVYDLGTENNHKTLDKAEEDGVTATVTTGEEITEKAAINVEGQTLQVVLDDKVEVDEDEGTITREKTDVEGLRGHYIRVEFKATLTDEAKDDIAKLVTSDINENDPLDVTDAQAEHSGIPNKASYEIEVANKPKYEDESNVVTVTPTEDKFPVKISKTTLGGTELPGAQMTLSKASGKLVHNWTSGKEAEEIELAPGKYILEEIVEPEGYQRVTTKIEFTVDKDGKVGLLTTKVDAGGKISVENGDHVKLADAPAKVYEEGEVCVDITGTKLQEGKELVGGEYEFELVDEDGEVVATAKNDATGKISFKNVGPFTQEGEYTFIMREVKGDKANVDYDDSTFRVVVTVKDVTPKDDEDADGSDDAADDANDATDPADDANKDAADNANDAADDTNKDAADDAADDSNAADDTNNDAADDAANDGADDGADDAADDAANDAADDGNDAANDGANDAADDANAADTGDNAGPADTAGDAAVSQATNTDNIAYIMTTLTPIFKTEDTDAATDGAADDADADAEDAEEAPIKIKKVLEATVSYPDGEPTFVNTYNKIPVKISKTDLGGEELPGAVIALTGPDGFEESWESTEEAYELELEPGEYTMVEEVAPEGYKRVTTEMKFVVKEDGTVELITTTVDNGGNIKVMDGNHVVLEDAPEKPDLPSTDKPEKPEKPQTPPETPDKPTPPTPDKPTPELPTTPGPETPAPKTGDMTNIGLWVGIMAAVLLSLLVLLTIRPKKNSGK